MGLLLFLAVLGGIGSTLITSGSDNLQRQRSWRRMAATLKPSSLMVVGLLCLSLVASREASASPPTLEQGIAFFRSFDDGRAEEVFRRLLRTRLSRKDEAKVHLYLGLIALNALDSDLTIEEFRRAIVADPAVELMADAPRKARVAFEEASRAAESGNASPGPTAPPANGDAAAVDGAEGVPAAAVAPRVIPPDRLPDVVDVGKVHRSHWLGISLGAVGLVAAGLAIYAVVDVANTNAQVATINGGGPASTPYSPGLSSTYAAAHVWSAAMIPLAVVGALGIAAGVVTW